MNQAQPHGTTDQDLAIRDCLSIKRYMSPSSTHPSWLPRRVHGQRSTRCSDSPADDVAGDVGVELDGAGGSVVQLDFPSAPTGTMTRLGGSARPGSSGSRSAAAVRRTATR